MLPGQLGHMLGMTNQMHICIAQLFPIHAVEEIEKFNEEPFSNVIKLNFISEPKFKKEIQKPVGTILPKSMDRLDLEQNLKRGKKVSMELGSSKDFSRMNRSKLLEG